MRGHAAPQDIGQFHSPWITPCKSTDYFISLFQPGEVFHIKNIFSMKTLTDFRKTVESGVDPRPKSVTLAGKRSKQIGQAVSSNTLHEFITIGRSCPNLRDTIRI